MSPSSRRDWLVQVAACAGCALLAAPGRAQAAAEPGESLRDADFPAIECQFYKKLPEKRIQCQICPRECAVAELERGTCGSRENRGGLYFTLAHSRAVALHNDPIEKKPFFHVLPGSKSLSVAAAGCNLECKFCQNWEISQARPEQIPARLVSPRRLHERARALGAPSITFTYTEPVTFYEYAHDTAQLSAETGVRTLLVTAAFIQGPPLAALAPRLGAIKVDLKALREPFYEQWCRGRLKPVLDALLTIRKAGTWLEIVVLVIPTLNDGEAENRELARWVAQNLGRDVPVHFTRFHPMFRLRNLPPTPVSTLERCQALARAEGLRFAYVGNVPGHPGENTLCPGCSKVVVRRYGFHIDENRLRAGRCPDCGAAVPGVWS